MSDIETLSAVTAGLRAVHQQPFGQVPHVHRWEVEAIFRGELVDGRVRQNALIALLAPLAPDMNRYLGEDATNEGLARWVLRQLRATGCIAVTVTRKREGLSARAAVRGALG